MPENADLPEAICGVAAPIMTEYVRLLLDVAQPRGFIGPGEAEIVWPRHIANCAPVANYLPANSSLCDVGSGAGLPGIVIAIMRPDVVVTCLESMAKRCVFLKEVVDSLGLDNVTVINQRSDQYHAQQFDTVTARAVARLPQLIHATHHLLRSGGELVALKGVGVNEEIRKTSNDKTITRLGACRLQVLRDYFGQPVNLAIFQRTV